MLKEAESFWSAIAGKVKSLIRKETQNTFRCERYDVTTAPNNGVIGVTLPMGSTEIFIPYSSEVENAAVGDTVLVVWWGSMSNAKAYYFGNGYEGGGGGVGTDDKVEQTATTTSGYTYWRPLVIGQTSASTEAGGFSTVTNSVRVFDNMRVQPSTGTIKAPIFKGNLTGTAMAIPFGQVDDTSTSTAFTATVPGISALTDGVCMMLKNGVVTSAAGFTIDVNGLGAKPSYNNMAAATQDSTIFNVNYTMIFVYDSTRVEGGCWVCYRGYNSNDNTIGYQIRTNSQTMAVSGACYRYRLLFTSADGKKYVPANTSSSTNATASRTVNQTPIDPFGDIFYYGYTTAISSGSRPGTAYLWRQYNITLGYSFNRTGAALTLTQYNPVFIKCAPQADGSAIMDATTPYVQSLPSSADGKIYIFLGIATSATTVEISINHPVYEYKDGAIRLWTNAASNGGGAVTSVNGQTGAVSLDASDVGALSDNTSFVSSFNGSTGAVTYTAPVTSVNGQTGTVSLTIPTNTNQLTNGAGFVDSAGAAAAAPVQSVNGQTGTVSLSIPTKTSDLTNDSGFLTSVPVTSVNGQTGAVVLDASDVGALPNSTSIPTKTSDLTNDSGFLTSAVTSFNGSTGAVTYTAPVTSVNSKTGAVSLTASDVGALPDTYTAPVTSVNGNTGAVTTPNDKVTQTETTTSGYSNWRSILVSNGSASTWNGSIATATNQVRHFNNLRYQPSTGTLRTTTFVGALTGTASGNLKSGDNVSSLTNDAGYLTLATLPVWDGSVT